MAIDVILVAVGRDTVSTTVTSLLEAADHIQRIHLIGQESEAASLQSATGRDNCTYTSVPCKEPFCKSALLNIGLRRACADNVLISDADIIWNRGTILLMSNYVDAHGGFCYVAEVEESDPTYRGGLVRYEPSVKLGDTIELSVVPDVQRRPNHARPGPGLIMASRESWLDVGGFNEALVGWGWEDQDLIIRARIIGHDVSSLGRVIHISHDDSIRNLRNGLLPKSFTRNVNISVSLKMLGQGIVRGPLSHDSHVAVSIEIRGDFE